jgi:hypothetical protein
MILMELHEHEVVDELRSNNRTCVKPCGNCGGGGQRDEHACVPENFSRECLMKEPHAGWATTW